MELIDTCKGCTKENCLHNHPYCFIQKIDELTFDIVGNIIKTCIYCQEILSDKNVYMYNSRKNIVDKCENCTDKLESGVDMYE